MVGGTAIAAVADLALLCPSRRGQPHSGMRQDKGPAADVAPAVQGEAPDDGFGLGGVESEGEEQNGSEGVAKAQSGGGAAPTPAPTSGGEKAAGGRGAAVRLVVAVATALALAAT